MSKYTLRDSVDIYEQAQRCRIAAMNRLRARIDGKDETETAKIVASDEIVNFLSRAEEISQRNMEVLLQKHACYDWIMGVPGINRTLAGKILALIEDPMKFARFSNLRTFAGLTPGKNKLVKGEKAVFCRRLKVVLFNAFVSMQKSYARKDRLRNPPDQYYIDIYLNWRCIYAHRHGTGNIKKKKDGVDIEGNKYTSDDETAQAWPDLRQHYAAKNKLLDVFLFHIYEEWLHQLGNPKLATLYVHEVLGHHMKFERAAFRSDGMSARKKKEHARALTAI